MEYFRIDDSGRINDTQDRLTSRGFGYGGQQRRRQPVLRSFQSWFGTARYGCRPGFGYPAPERPVLQRAQGRSYRRRRLERPPRADPAHRQAQPTVTGF